MCLSKTLETKNLVDQLAETDIKSLVAKKAKKAKKGEKAKKAKESGKAEGDF